MEKRIYGLETEYAVIVSHKEGNCPVPTRSDIFTYLKDIISSHYKVLNSKEIKQGIFMENGGRLHHEACLSALLEGVIEFSTPECTSSRELAAYTRAQDEILNEVREELEEKIRTKENFSGKIFFGKNSTDNKGNFYGTHENYLVDDPIRGINRLFLYIVFFLFALSFLTVVIIFNLPILAILLVCALLYLLLILLHLFFSSIRILSGVIKKLKELVSAVFKLILSQKPNTFTRVMGELFRVLTILWAYSCGFFLRQVVFKKFTVYLTPFLLTRIIFCGAGRVFNDIPAGPGSSRVPFELSQKAGSIKTLCTIFWDDIYKPVVSLKNFIKSPFSLFNDQKRFHIMYSDSNMSDYVNYIKTGITGLVIRLIEEGHYLENLTPRNTIYALREFSRDLSMKKKIPLKNGRAMSSLEIQRYYLAEAKKFYSGKEITEETEELLKIWESLLSCLEVNPHMLYKELDWVAKKDLISELMKEREEILFTKELFLWSNFFSTFYNPLWESLGEEELEIEMKKKLSWFKKRQFESFLKKEELGCKEFLARFLLIHQLQKIDLRFHEINKSSGYHYKLANAGLITKIFNPEDIENAKVNPPEDTRANIRGYLIKSLSSRPIMALIGWDDIVINNYAKRIFFTDPFQKDLSDEDKNYMTSLSL